MEDQKEKFIDLLNRHTTPEMVFFNIINKLDNLPADFPQKNKKTLYEMYDALKFSRGKINVDDIRKFNACVSENFVMDDKSAVFWEAINFVWLIAQNAVANRPKFAGIKSGITRKNKQWDILTELSDPLEYACKELLKAENKQKQEIISDVVEQFDNEISAVKQKYKCKQDKYQFFEYYLKVLTNSKEFAMAENNPFKNIVKRRSPRSPESKERSKLGAKNRNQKNKI